MGIRVGIDIGGTFTDLIGIDEQTGEMVSVKTPSTPQDSSIGVIEAIKKAGIRPEEITYLVHGSTLGLNPLIEQKRGKVGLICTAGFRDSLEIRRVWREKLFDTAWQRPEALIPRKLRRGVTERVNWQGKVLTALQEQEVVETIQFLKTQGVESYAVCLLFSFLNPSHERRVREIILAQHPEAYVSLSSEVLPEIREYERTSTTVVNAILKPLMYNYLQRLQQQLGDIGVRAPLRILKVNGGVVNVETVLERPVEAFASGPSGGVTGALHFGIQLHLPNLITLDMGGTTTDISVIQNYQPLYTMEKDIAWNIPVRGLMLDVKSIGAGGGSITWYDPGGGVRVGPQSAGAFPGPACYNLGGQDATITDAQLYLGRINPNNFLYGTMPLEVAASTEVLARLGQVQEQSVEAMALKTYELSLNEMAQLIREVTDNRGQNPQEFNLVSFGGAGAMYAADLAEELGIPEVFIPANAGVFSAFGSLCADVIQDYLQTYYVSVEKLDFFKVNQIYEQMYQHGLQEIQQDNTAGEAHFTFYMDIRYVGEGFEITVPVEFQNCLTAYDLNHSLSIFHQEHKRLYGFDRPDEPLELVNLRVRVTVPQPKPVFSVQASSGNLAEACKEYRPVYFRSEFEFVTTPVYDWRRLGKSDVLAGPAVIEDGGTTIVVPPQHKCTVDEFGNIRIIVPPRFMSASRDVEQDPMITRLLQMEGTAYIKPVAREIIGNSLEIICREMGNTMIRTAYSPIFADGMDFSCGILDAGGELVAAVNYCPVHLAAMALAPEWALIEIGLQDLQPGDVILLNDPYCGGTHITDFTLIKPIFFEGKLVAMATNRAHHLDVGGKAAGGFPGDATEIFQEGIRIPPVKWFRGGVENNDIFDTLLCNVRLPWLQIGDFRAQLASVLKAEERIIHLCTKYGVATFREAINALKDYSEAWMRKEIHAIPDGTYSFADFIEDDGITQAARKIQVTIQVKGDSMEVDFSGTSPQAKGPLNAVYGVTASSTFNALLQLTDPLIPINYGLFRPVKITAPRGTLVNPNYPAATFGANTDTNLRIVEVIIGALAQVLPERVMAATYGTCNNFTGGGYDPIREQPFVFYFFNEGGWGARFNRDGLTSTFNPIGNCKDVPVEIVESNYPFLYEKAELYPDSAGAGKFRGGFGTVRTLRVLADQIEVNALGERHKLKPYGLYGGEPAKSNAFLVQRSEAAREGDFAQVFGVTSPSKFANILLNQGDRFSLVMSGGGGYGIAIDRDPLLVLADVLEGVVSPEQAEQVYGVVILNQPGTGPAVDWPATTKLRREMSREPLKNIVNEVITVDDISAGLRRNQQQTISPPQDNITKRLTAVRERLDLEFCQCRCPYKAEAKVCPLHNEAALQYWSIDAIQRWMRKHCMLKVKI